VVTVHFHEFYKDIKCVVTVHIRSKYKVLQRKAIAPLLSVVCAAATHASVTP